MSTGNIATVVGGPAGATNTLDFSSTNNGSAGDAMLDGLKAPFNVTRDAAGLTFTITSNVPRVLSCKYVFGSEEYNEWVNTFFNDRYAIYINGVNHALVPAMCGGPPFVPVSISNVDNSNPFGAIVPPPDNVLCYVNNDCNDGLGGFPCAPPNRETELDGLTAVLRTIPFVMVPNVAHTIKLVIADNGDRVYDSDAFLQCTVDAGRCIRLGVNRGGCTCEDGVTADECTDGTFELGEICEDLVVPCPAGACCLPTEECVETSGPDCVAAGGVYGGDGTTCDPIGACDQGDNVCVETTDDCCSGAYQGDGTTCTPVGACCEDHIACSITTAAGCNGTYLGDGTACVAQACNPLAHVVPAVSEWGAVVLALLVLTAGTIVVARHRRNLVGG
jgi:hypothetical protein